MKKVTSKSVLRRLSIQLRKDIEKCKACKGTGEFLYAHSCDEKMCLVCRGKGYIIKKESDK